ncbi:MAG: bacillithiol biosynthesis BshC [Gemmatimonadaceae bacterium]
MTDVRILSEPLGGSPLSQLLQRGEAPTHWLLAAPAGADAWRERAQARAAAKDWATSWERLAPAIDATGEAAARLERVRRAGGVVVTTGQQPGLFGGPIYTWSKAVGALALADAIEAATGIPTAAVFWAATDDADFIEASSTVVARIGGADTLRDPHAPPAGTPMSLAPLGDVGSLVRTLASACGSAPDHRALDAVRSAYANDGRTVGGAYVALLRELLAPLGVPVLDASHPVVIAESAVTIELALERAGDIERALATRAQEIDAAGHEPQVEDMPGLSLAFARSDSVKRRLAVGEARGDASALTPNVLLRPIVEHEILPTVAYVAGPGELAYFAQVTAVAAAMELPSPVAVPRWSCTLLEPHVEAVLQRLGFQHDELSVPHVAERRVAREAMSETTAAGVVAMRAAIAELPQRLGDEPRRLGLDAAIVGAARALDHRVDRLERRLLAGVARRETERMRDLATARSALYPDGVRQERALNLIPLLARHGLELLSDMHLAARGHALRLVGSETAATVGSTRAAPVT